MKNCKFYLLTALVICALLFAGCDNNTPPEQPTAPEGQETVTEITTERTTDAPTAVATEAPTEPETEHTHAFGDWVITLEATCTEEGKQERNCACGEKEDEAIPAKGYVFVNRVCTRCGEINLSEGLSFASNGDGTCSVTGIGTSTDTDVVIPSVSPAGDTVTSIGDLAFAGCTVLTSITIPEGVESIGYRAFYECPNLTIYCSRLHPNDGWATFWNYSLCPVVWGYTGE